MIGFIGAWQLKKIMKKTHSGMIGFSSDEDDPIALGDDEFGGELELEGGGGHNPFLEVSAEFDDGSNPIAVPVGGDVVDPPTLPMPSPLRCSPHHHPQSQSLTNAAGEVVQQVVQQVVTMEVDKHDPQPAARARSTNDKDGRTPPPLPNNVKDPGAG